MTKHIFVVLAFLVVLTSCSNPPVKSLSSFQDDGVKQLSINGQKGLVSNKINSVYVGNSDQYYDGYKYSFAVAVINKSREEITFGPDHIKISSNEIDIKIADKSKIIKKIGSRAKWSAFFTALGENDEKKSTTDFSGNYQTNYPYETRGSFSGTATTTDPVATEIARARTDQQVANVYANADKRSKNVEMTYLVENTMLPNQENIGLIAFNIPNKAFVKGVASLDVEVSVGTEKHTFHFQFSK